MLHPVSFTLIASLSAILVDAFPLLSPQHPLNPLEVPGWARHARIVIPGLCPDDSIVSSVLTAVNLNSPRFVFRASTSNTLAIFTTPKSSSGSSPLAPTLRQIPSDYGRMEDRALPLY